MSNGPRLIDQADASLFGYGTSIIRERSGEILLVTEYSGGFCHHKVASANGPTENTKGSVPHGESAVIAKLIDAPVGTPTAIELIEVRLPKSSIG
jgi:hypothetical protein